MKQYMILICAALIVSGCARIAPMFQPHSRIAAPRSALQSIGINGQNAAALDQTTAAQRAAAVSAPPPKTAAQTAVLGVVTVGLGSPALQGFWLSTALVTAPQKGRVLTKSGKSVAVELRPSRSGAQLSFAAYRALGLALTDLPQVQVSGAN